MSSSGLSSRGVGLRLHFSACWGEKSGMVGTEVWAPGQLPGPMSFSIMVNGTNPQFRQESVLSVKSPGYWILEPELWAWIVEVFEFIPLVLQITGSRWAFAARQGGWTVTGWWPRNKRRCTVNIGFGFSKPTHFSTSVRQGFKYSGFDNLGG